MSNLPAIDDEVVSQGIQLPVLYAREQVRVVATLAELHDDVEDYRPSRAAPASCPIYHIDVSQENIPVHLLLL